MRLAMTLAVNTTMRNKEVRVLRWRDVNLFDKSVEIRRSKTNASERVIPLNPDAFAAITELRERAKILFGDTLEPESVKYTNEGTRDGRLSRERSHENLSELNNSTKREGFAHSLFGPE